MGIVWRRGVWIDGGGRKKRKFGNCGKDAIFWVLRQLIPKTNQQCWLLSSAVVIFFPAHKTPQEPITNSDGFGALMILSIVYCYQTHLIIKRREKYQWRVWQVSFHTSYIHLFLEFRFSSLSWEKMGTHLRIHIWIEYIWLLFISERMSKSCK